MRYRLFGNTGLKVSEICLGTMTFGEEFKWGSDEKSSLEVFKTYVEAGGNFLDTANYYTKGTSETLIGKFASKVRQNLVIATKYTLSQDPKDPNASGNHRKNLFRSLEESLKRLKTDYIDIYWVHAFDGITPIEETLRALDDAVRQGKILYAGISDAPAWVISKGNTEAFFRNKIAFSGIQVNYSLIERTSERDLIPMAEDFKMAVTAWSPLGMGVLAGKYSSPEGKKGPKESRFAINPEFGKRFLSEKNLTIAKTVQQIAKKLNVTAAEVALNWLLQRPFPVIPIVGAKNKKQLQENLGCLNFKLNEKDLKLLDEASDISLGFPHDFLKEAGIRKLIHGEVEDKLLL